jgi:hypothetical protein
VLALTATGCSRVVCFSADDSSPGWKRVELPAEAPSLAAPGDIDQFRSDEPAWVWEDDRADTRAYRAGPGSASLEIDVSDGARAAEVELAQPLDGARVEIDGDRPSADPLPLLRRRVSGDRLRVEWDDPAVSRLRLTIRHHLRPRPVISHARTARRIALTARAGTPPAFRRNGSLYFRQPQGPPLLLCNAPNRLLSMHVTSLDDAPRDAKLQHRFSTWQLRGQK